MGNKILKNASTAGLFFFIGCIAWSCASDQLGLPPIPEGPEPPQQAYIGSDQCALCHSDVYNSFLTTGHPYILSKAEGGQAPEYPFTILDHTPSGYGWNDITYVIGGFAWKANYIDSDGYLITNDDAQWNFETEEAVPFHTGEEPGTKMYDCGRCHTTGWVSLDDGGVPQDDLAGMAGEFFAAGVQCEACHGMGALHKASQSKDDIIVDRSAEQCGTCHYRNEDHTIAAGDGFIKHYAQYDEMIAAGHSALSCNDCHDPHNSVKHGQTAGIITNCTDCHTDTNNKHEIRGASCETCHLPYATKSAVERTKYQADIQTHIFKINVDPDGEMFNEDGTIANGETGVTLDYVCYQCHRDADGEGGNPDLPFTSRKTLEELSAYATGFHD